LDCSIVVLFLCVIVALNDLIVKQGLVEAAILNVAIGYNRGGEKEYEVRVRRSERRVN
jgi:hypothetical protein